MFTVKLATNETFAVSAVEQSYSAMDYTGRKKFRLRMESTPAEHDLEWYLDRLKQNGALESIRVLRENGETCLELGGYTELESSSMRLLTTGDRELVLSVVKPDAVAEVPVDPD